MDNARTVDALLAAASPDPARPLVTFYDDATGERTELSGATLGNWVAKTANMLVDDLDAGPGQWASVLLPPHWQTAAVLLGCWTAGLAVTTRPEPADVCFVDAATAAAGRPTGDGYVLGLHPFGLPLPSVPAGYVDYNAEVRAHGDHFRARVPVRPETPATPERTQAGLCSAAAERAVALGIERGARVMVDVDAHPDPLDWLLAPLAATASTVLCRHSDKTKLGARKDAELVTHFVGA